MNRAKTTVGHWAFAAFLSANAAFLSAIGSAAFPCQAAETNSQSEPFTAVELKEQLASPRATWHTLIESVNEKKLIQAAQCLDMPPADIDPIHSAELASKLKVVIDHLWVVKYDDVKTPPANITYNLGDNTRAALADYEDRQADARKIEMRYRDGLWRFSPATVTEIPALWTKYVDLPEVTGLKKNQSPQSTMVGGFSEWLASKYPSTWSETLFLLPTYQWVSLLILIVIGFIADRVAQQILHSLTAVWLRYFKTSSDTQIDKKLWRPAGLLTQALVWYGGTTLIGLPDFTLMVLLAGLKLFAVVAGVWNAFLLINIIARFLAQKALKSETKFDDLLVPLCSKSFKVFVVCVGLLTVAQAFNLPIAGLVGGLGLGGMALALASKDAVANLFGSVMILSDRPFEVGDRIAVKGEDGTVETVGFRSTRIRTLEGHLVSIPNGEMANQVIRNIAKRPNLRRRLNLGITYDTPMEKIRKAIEIVEELLRDHEGMDPEKPPRVYFDDFTESSLNLCVTYWYHPPNWWDFCAFNQRFNTELLRKFNDEGIEFAFPSQTLYLAGDPARPLPAKAS